MRFAIVRLCAGEPQKRYEWEHSLQVFVVSTAAQMAGGIQHRNLKSGWQLLAASSTIKTYPTFGRSNPHFGVNGRIAQRRVLMRRAPLFVAQCERPAGERGR
jgi:hypothetical protein